MRPGTSGMPLMIMNHSASESSNGQESQYFFKKYIGERAESVNQVFSNREDVSQDNRQIVVEEHEEEPASSERQQELALKVPLLDIPETQQRRYLGAETKVDIAKIRSEQLSAMRTLENNS